MAESETSLRDLMDDMDLGDVSETGYERDVDVEVIDGFYYQNMAFMNDKVQVFAEYWMKLYSNCCLQRDYAMELLNDGRLDEAKEALKDWPDTFGSPNVPQLLSELPQEPKRKKPSALSIECDGAMRIKEMRDNYVRGEMVRLGAPNVVPRTDVPLGEYELHFRECDDRLKSAENCVIRNAYVYGMWLSHAFKKFQDEKRMKRVSGNFNEWIDSRCKVKKTRARQLRTFYELFHPYEKVLGCRLPFVWFVRNGPAVVKYFESHQEVAQPWTHELDCACGSCDFTTAVA